jgi:hypothetical protein
VLTARIGRYNWAAAAAMVCLCLPGCGAGSNSDRRSAAIRALREEARPIGRGVGFHEPVTGRVPGPCRNRLGPRAAVHVELFADDRVVLVPPGIGVRGPVHRLDGRITAARCYGDIVTLDPTGVVLVRPRSHPTLQRLFSAWGQPLSPNRLAAFAAGPHQHVRIYAGGRRLADTRAVPLTRHAEIVLEVGPYIRPHSSFTFAGR